MQLSFRLDKRPGESHLALDGKNLTKMGNMQAELETLNQQRVARDPAILLDCKSTSVC